MRRASLPIGACLAIVLAGAAGAQQCPVPTLPDIRHSTAAIGSVHEILLSKALYPNAVCNNHHQAAYYLQRGAGPSARRWVILLQSGGACTGLSPPGSGGLAACDYRAKFVLPHASEPNGILSTDPAENPDFYDATKIVVSYCSSDYWSGNLVTPKQPGPFTLQNYNTWSFAGRYILDAAIDDMLARTPQGQLPTEILYTGTSAGGLGVLLTVNDVAARLAKLPIPPRLVAASDAGYLIGVPNFDPSQAAPYLGGTDPFQLSLKSGAPIWGGRGDLKCVTDPTQKNNPNVAIDCRTPQYLLSHGYIHVPLLIEQSREDDAQFCSDGVPRYLDGVDQCLPTPDPQHAKADAPAYEQCFAYMMESAIQNDALTPNAPRVSAYVPGDEIHVQSTNTALFKLERAVTDSATALSDRDALGAWYRQPCIGKNWQQTPVVPMAACAMGQ